MIDTLIEKCRLDASSAIADVGSGTGIFTHQLLSKGLRVIAIEPNQEVRQAAETMLSGFEGFKSMGGNGCRTGMPVE